MVTDEYEDGQVKLILAEKHLNSSSIIFYTFDLDIDDLLKLSPCKMIASDVFKCNNLPLVIYLKISDVSEEEYLSFGISCKYDKKTDWSVKMKARKILMKFSRGNKRAESNCVLTSKSNSNWTDNFISIDKLTDLNNNFIGPDNKIKLALDLKLYDFKENRNLFKNLFK